MSDTHLTEKHFEVIQNFENLLEEGIGNQTMSDIASNLRVSLRTLYEIAPSKEMLVISTIDRILTNIAKQALSSLKNMDSSVEKLQTFTKIGNEAAGPRIQKYAIDLSRIKGADDMIKSHELAYIEHIKRLLDDATEKNEIKSLDTRAVAIMLGTVARIFSKKNHQEKLAASAEDSANMISGLIIDGLIKSK
ncbi:MAG: TetR/AcrR family transcriptional regulator [Gammaproteobacteria bacterium]|jgi:AcrR family transcriptional regulator|nr:TetR/AcrR family transcriptional regulator [Gammaproteobacteria bacterium]HJM09741.1 TetR/AcrR family transcriptional regulator [Gammaproteobacteria bacterium]HJN00085.1 TetR/AcrR family transcriptional regulator [Gammaproteobacteria bacterium]|tara:strand:- start:4534 stop:5109 length:576 start_codon:yes stop_codon:yes gene_type:complete